jgi:competence protein ComGG
VKGEKGFTMPFTIIFSFFLFTFLIHQANLLLMEKGFYQEAEEMVILDILMHRAVQDVRNDLQTTNTISRTYSYEEGSADVSARGESVISVAIECKTKQNRTYKAAFQYNKDTAKLTNWSEER